MGPPGLPGQTIEDLDEFLESLVGPPGPPVRISMKIFQTHFNELCKRYIWIYSFCTRV